MFYDLHLLSKNGKFSLLWCAATTRSCVKITKAEFLLVDIGKKCDEIMVYVNTKSNNVRHRFSLYLAAQLVYGLIYIYSRQVGYLLNDLHLVHLHIRDTYRLKKKVKRRLTDKSNVQDVLRRTAEEFSAVALPSITNEQILYDKSGTVVNDPSSIQIVEELPPIQREPRPVGDFGDENYIPGISFGDTIPPIGPVINTEDVQSYPAIVVKADVHPIPPDVTNIEVPIVDPNMSNSNVIQPHAGTRNDQLEEITTETDQLIADVNGHFGPKSKSTPIQPPRPKANQDDSLIQLESDLDLTSIQGRGHKRKRVIIDIERKIPSDVFINQINETHYERPSLIDLNALKFQQDLFRRSAHRMLSTQISKWFKPIASGRQHKDNIVNEILSIRPDINASGAIEMSGNLSLLTSSGVGGTPVQKSWRPGDITIQAQEPQPPLPTLETIRECSGDQEPGKLSGLRGSKSLKPNAIPNIIVERPSSDYIPSQQPRPTLGTIRQSTVAEPIPEHLPQDNVSSSDRSTSSVSTFTKRNQLKNDVLERLEELWKNGIEDISFYTLCPRDKTNRMTAAFVFNYLLELHKAKKVILLPEGSDSIKMGYIRKYSNSD